jgi:hypothetical protein
MLPIVLCAAAACSVDDAEFRTQVLATDDAGTPPPDPGSSDDGGTDTDDEEEECECQYIEEDVVLCDAEVDGETTSGDDSGSGGDGSTGVALAPGSAPELVAPLDPQDDKKKGAQCCPPYPAGCNPLDGTKIKPIRWMEQFRQATASNPWVNAPLTFNQLTDAQVDQIIANCQNKPTEIDKLVCVAKAVDVAVGGTEDASGEFVCRHHMGSLYKVLKKMGYGDTATGSVTHAWNEVAIDTNGDGVADTIVVLDSFNDIYYTVPK